MEGKTILILAPHTDDGELGCGGTIAKMTDEGNTVYQVAFSSAANTVVHGMKNEMLIDEIKEAADIVGIDPNKLFIHDFKVRNFNENRQDILDLMLYYKRKLKPEIVFIPSSTDIHQDHQVIHNESLRAFKECTLLGYELPWNMTVFNSNVYSELNIIHLNSKISALSRYKSQKHRRYMNQDYIKSCALVRGIQCNKEYAETFESIRIFL